MMVYKPDDDPKVFVINLDDRTDRWSAIQASCTDVGLNPIRVPAVRSSPGWIGHGHSVLRCLQMAKEQNLPWVTVLEDDATFTRESIDRFRSLLPYLWQNRDKWDRFNGGPTLPPDPFVKILNKPLKLMYARGYCTHFNLIHAAAYDIILGWEKNTVIDVYMLELETRFRTVFNSIATFPHISVQRISTSDISPNADGSTSDYSSYFRYSEQELQKCLENS